MRRGRTFVVMASAIVAVTASCEEHFPAPLVTASGAADIPDATADASSDAEPAADAKDANADANVDTDPDAAGNGPCNVRMATPAVAASPHVPEGTGITYTSNPPSSGPHYPAWANFQEFTHPVDDGYLVHSMEHGAVLLLYECADDGGTCADMIAQLRVVREAVPTDPLCDPGVRVRVILAPRSANDAAVTAAAWGNTYRADCVDAPSLAAFIKAHYAQGPEDFCYPGSVF
jgi:hypothetical protein